MKIEFVTDGNKVLHTSIKTLVAMSQGITPEQWEMMQRQAESFLECPELKNDNDVEVTHPAQAVVSVFLFRMAKEVEGKIHG